MSNVSRYPKQVFWSDEDQGYIAVAPDLPGSSAFGETEQEAMNELDSAIAEWISAAECAGNPVPPPSQPAADAGFSGRVLLRMPKRLHKELAAAAERDNVSLNQHLVATLRLGHMAQSIEAVARSTISRTVMQIVGEQRHIDMWQSASLFDPHTLIGSIPANPGNSANVLVGARNVVPATFLSLEDAAIPPAYLIER